MKIVLTIDLLNAASKSIDNDIDLGFVLSDETISKVLVCFVIQQ